MVCWGDKEVMEDMEKHMNDDLISRSALKKAIDDYIEEKTLHWLSDIEEIIDNAPAVESVSMDLHEKILDQTISELFKCQEELEKVRNGERSQDEWVRKVDVIQSIAKQYNEHNELVPMWLRISDIGGGAE
jgi:hypothetical protein